MNILILNILQKLDGASSLLEIGPSDLNLINCDETT